MTPSLRGNRREDTEHPAVVVDLGAYRRDRYPDPDAELARIFARERRGMFRVVSDDDDGPRAA